jgi:hypothetical protein
MNLTANPTTPTAPRTPQAPPRPTTRTRRRFTARAAPFRPDPGTATPQDRLREALAVLDQERAPGGDYHPADADVIAAWDDTSRLCADDGALALDHLDAFLRCHLGTLRDLMVRAARGHGPHRLLDDLRATVAAQLALGGG